jgi:multiple sugar transport system ATP-binding protein
MNIFQSQLLSGEGRLKVAFGGRSLALEPELVSSDLDRYLNLPLLAGLRPEAFSLADDNTPSDRRIEVEIEAVEALGYEMLIYFPVAVQQVAVDVEAATDKELLQHSTADVAIFAARLPVMRNLHSKAKLSLAIDTSQLYLFESSGKAIQWKVVPI